MAAGLAMLTFLKDNPATYEKIDNSTNSIVDGIRKQLAKKGLNFSINHVGSMFTLFFTDKSVIDFNTATASDTKLFATFFRSMLQQGIYMAPSQYEAMFISASIDDNTIDRILNATDKAFDAL
jgi:glutamate-1-semialdehyde 2,1-aminomutase